VQQVQSVKRILAELNLAEIPSILALNKADLMAPDALEAAVRQARQLDSGETVVISAIKPATLDALLEKAGAVLARDLAARSDEDVEHRSTPLSRIA
jgi:50S ribosomal subunit-associated GTPase HflX